MSIHVSSEDVASGTRYNGTWNLPTSLFENYTLDSQYMDTSAIPWMWNGCKALRITSYDVLDTQETTVNFDYASIGLSNNTTTISSSFETTINNALNGLPGAFARSVTVTYTSDVTGKYYTFTFNGQVSLNYAYGGSTAKYVFGKRSDETDTVFYVNANFITTTPKFLEIYITQSNTKYNTSRSTYPTMLWSTGDFELTGQNFYFKTAVRTLTIAIFRTNIPIDPVPITNKWDIVFS
jgi:hypothetical protein